MFCDWLQQYQYTPKYVKYFNIYIIPFNFYM